MPDKTVPLTREGKAKLEDELNELREKRRLVADRIHNAQELGTSQNDAEYDDAKLEQGMVEGRILELEDIMRRAVEIDEKSAHKSGRVVVGSGVEVEQDGKKRHYQIVGAPEADPTDAPVVDAPADSGAPAPAPAPDPLAELEAEIEAERAAEADAAGGPGDDTTDPGEAGGRGRSRRKR